MFMCFALFTVALPVNLAAISGNFLKLLPWNMAVGAVGVDVC
jgi:hypothetical protein